MGYVRACDRVRGPGAAATGPLCNGEIIPRAPAVATLIELTHRPTSGVAFALVVGLVVAAWRVFPASHAVRCWATLSGIFMVSVVLGSGLDLADPPANQLSDHPT